MFICTKCDKLHETDWEDGVGRKEADSVTDAIIARLIEIKPPPDDPAYMAHFRQGVLDRAIEKTKNICDDCYISIETQFPLFTSISLNFVEEAIKHVAVLLAESIMLLPQSFRSEVCDTHLNMLPPLVKAELARRGSGNLYDAGQSLIAEVKRLIGETRDKKGENIDPELNDLLGQAEEQADNITEMLSEYKEEANDGDDSQQS